MRYLDYYSKLTIQQIIYFLETARYESISKAAASLHISHSAVSKSIQSMEFTLGLSLFIRNKQRVYLTPAGKVLRQKLDLLMVDMEDAILQANYVQSVKTEPITIGLPSAISYAGFLHETLEHYQKLHPESDFCIESYMYPELPKMLFEGKIDVAFSICLDQKNFSDELSYQQIIRCPTMVYMHKDNPLCKENSLHIADLQPYDLLLPHSLSHRTYVENIREMCSQHGFVPRFYRYVNTIEHLWSNIRHKNEIALFNYFTTNENPNVVTRPLIDIEDGIIVACAKNHLPSRINDFINETIAYWRNQGDRFL